MNEILDRLQPIFREVLENNDLVITTSSSAKNVEGWDSLAHINLVSVIEQEFKIRFALGELETLNNVGDMIELMKKKMKR
ncbi:MAG: acyl carrier protein [Methylococcales bacterium]|nr:acyl carrier protein [Methylococcales bacterium]